MLTNTTIIRHTPAPAKPRLAKIRGTPLLTTYNGGKPRRAKGEGLTAQERTQRVREGRRALGLCVKCGGPRPCNHSKPRFARGITDGGDS